MSTVDIADAEAERTTTGDAIRLEATAEGRAELTLTNAGKRIAFLVNGRTALRGT